MALQRSLIVSTVLATILLGAAGRAGAQTTPPPEPTPRNGTTQAAPATGATPANPSTPATPSKAGDPSTTPGPDEGDDMSMTFHSSRKQDMQQFAEGSLQELSIGQAKPRFALNLFGDLSLGGASRSEGNVKPDAAFAVGVFDMLFNADLDGKILATAEMTFKYEPSAPLAELERLHLRWKPNKYLFLEAGRFHTDIGYWNVAYHHGKWLQLSIERPRTIALHGGLLPVHWIGAQAGVNIPIGKGTISLVGSAGSSRDPISGTGAAHNQHGTAFTPFNAGHVKLEAAGFGLSDLRVGVSGVYTRIAAVPSTDRPALPDQAFDEYIGNAYIAYPSVPLTLIAEGYVIEHRVPSGALSSGIANAKWRTYAAFAMIGYTIGRITPYIKGEYIKSDRNVDRRDPLWVPEPRTSNQPSVTMDVTEGTVGVRVDTSTWSALKFEYRVTGGVGARREFDVVGRPLETPVIHTGTANWSFGI